MFVLDWIFNFIKISSCSPQKIIFFRHELSENYVHPSLSRILLNINFTKYVYKIQINTYQIFSTLLSSSSSEDNFKTTGIPIGEKPSKLTALESIQNRIFFLSL